ncbi:MAG: L,D-transpeptidase [Polyangiaceae bacterium]|nr:L,D-transpeptidase [Polyangiaceae bacterium]
MIGLRANVYTTALLGALLVGIPLSCVEAPAVTAPAPQAPKPAPSPASTATAAMSAVAPVESTQVEPPPPPVDNRPKIGSIRWLTYIYGEPARKKDVLPIGAVRYGTAVVLKSTEPVPGSGCATKWYAIEPLGYVCADDTTTTDFDSPYWKALSSVAPAPGPWPYKYAFSTGAPMYTRVPTKAEQESAERDLGPIRTFKTLGKWSYGHERLVDTDAASAIKADSPIPSYFENHGSIAGSPWNPKAKPNIRFIPNGSGFSYARAFEAEGRVWLLTPELFLIPADRVFPYKRNYFQGQQLGGEVNLPIAWVRGDTAVKYKREADGTFVKTDGQWVGKVAVPITGTEVTAAKTRYFETKEAGVWIAETADVSVVKQVSKLPKTIAADEKWLDARLLPGTMTAYVGLTPVFTTLWSGGKGGVPIPGGDPKRDATTELGTFAFQWKDQVATMSPDKGPVTVFWFADVPHIQYVHAPLAMHVSYWHPDFGFLRSAECLNLSAQDGQWLFNFTLPKLPDGWGSVRPSKWTGPSTKIVIRKE